MNLNGTAERQEEQDGQDGNGQLVLRLILFILFILSVFRPGLRTFREREILRLKESPTCPISHLCLYYAVNPEAFYFADDQETGANAGQQSGFFPPENPEGMAFTLVLRSADR
jgi:hypothetical protein